MNDRQVHRLERLMQMVLPPKHLHDADADPRPDLHVELTVAHGYDDGNTYEARLWTTGYGYEIRDRVYLRSDGIAYVYDSETDTSHFLSAAWWVPVPRPGYGWRLMMERHEGPLPPLR